MGFLYTLIAALLGLASAFSLFALSFNGYGWNYFAVILVMIATISAVAGKFFESWKQIILTFSMPYIFFFGLLIMGSVEKGGWLMNLSLIVVVTACIWLPAFLIAKLTK